MPYGKPYVGHGTRHLSRQIKLFTRWRVEGNLPEIAAILTDTGSFADWWPDAWLRAEVVDPGDESGLKRSSILRPRYNFPGGGPLSMRLIADERPQSWEMEVNGAIVGACIWSLHQDGPMADIGHEWRVNVVHPLFRWFGPIGRMMCRSKLRATMRRGETALASEVIRRRSHRSG